MRVVRKQAARASTTAAAVSGLLALTAACLLLAWQQRSSAAAWWPQPGSLAGAADALPDAAPPANCSAWQSVSRLHDRCMAELQGPTFQCCSGAGYACRICSEPLLQALRCVGPRHMLLRLPARCGAAQLLPGPPPPPPPPPGQPGSQRARASCQLPSAAVLGGRWVAASSTPWAGMPGLPGALFQPAGGACDRRRPLVGPAVSRCLRAAGFDRLLISGDSTVRQLFTQLVSILRQQATVVDGGDMVHGHYSWQAWPGEAESLAAGGSSRSSSGGGLITDTLWLSPTANHIQGTWNQSIMQAGLERLLQLTSAARSAQGPPAGDSSGSGGSHNGSTDGIGRAAEPPSAPPFVADFVVGSRAEWQQRLVRQYLNSQLSGGTAGAAGRMLVLLSLCVWEVSAVWPSGWLDFVHEVQARAAQVVLLTCPTDRLSTPDKAKARQVVAERNRLLRQMVARSLGGSAGEDEEGADSSLGSGNGGGGSSGAGTESSSGGAGTDGSGTVGSSSGSSGGGVSGKGELAKARPLMLLDIDALTRHVSERTTIAPEDYHYQCYLSSNTQYRGGPLAWAGGDGAPFPAYPAMTYDHLRVPVNGMCGDPVNFAAWQLLLSMLCSEDAL